VGPLVGNSPIPTPPREWGLGAKGQRFSWLVVLKLGMNGCLENRGKGIRN